MSGAFTGEPAAGLKETVLLNSSKESELVDGFMASMGGASIMNGFKSSGVNYKLAVRLTGKFKTAFPDGLPEDKTDSSDTNNVASGTTNSVAKADNSLKESKAETSVVLFGDSDLLADDFSLRKEVSPFGTRVERDECESWIWRKIWSSRWPETTTSSACAAARHRAGRSRS